MTDRTRHTRWTRLNRRIVRTLSISLAAAGLMTLAGCEMPTSTTTPDASAADHTNLMVGDGLQFMADQSWVSVQPASSMRFAQFSIPVGDDNDQAAELVVYYFGDTGAGSIDANITRWLGQIAQPDGSDTVAVAKIADRTLGGMTTKTVDVTGTYVAETSPGSGAFHNKPDWRLVAAIVQTQAGPYYFKLTGQDAIVSQCLSSYQTMLATIRPAQVTGQTQETGHPR